MPGIKKTNPLLTKLKKWVCLLEKLGKYRCHSFFHIEKILSYFKSKEGQREFAE